MQPTMIRCTHCVKTISIKCGKTSKTNTCWWNPFIKNHVCLLNMNDHFQLLLQETEENQQEEIDHILNQEEFLKKHFNQDLLLDLDQFL